ncbi:hypothetical protein [Persicirhabdus sediminis]|uniref:Uncharacterized protein n=1 Tax=Persicirhabdus sediminis TaxID=454144 RepID=A0A8J7MG68_9BACT|nr:hypothetical protein [Persicirhabdus sediminis]MBK1792447.1 hypothetical protein [Persicirhabdus sediminis]
MSLPAHAAKLPAVTEPCHLLRSQETRPRPVHQHRSEIAKIAVSWATNPSAGPFLTARGNFFHLRKENPSYQFIHLFQMTGVYLDRPSTKRSYNTSHHFFIYPHEILIRISLEGLIIATPEPISTSLPRLAGMAFIMRRRKA